jgi:carbonic anhydrase
MSFAQLLERNRAFLAARQPKPLPPPESIAQLVVACYDPRLDALLKGALGLIDGGAFLIRTAGAVVTPSGDPLRSVALAAYLFDAKSIAVVGHTSCRMAAFEASRFIDAFRARGVTRDAFGAEDLRAWAGAIPDPKRGVQASVAVLRAAASLPRDLEIGGLLLDDATGALEVIVRPDEALPGVPARAASPEPVAAPVQPGAQAEPAAHETSPARDARDEHDISQAPAPARSLEPPVPEVTRLLRAAGALVQTVEAQAVWRYEVRKLRSELHTERNPIARIRLIDVFVRKAVAESREVAAALDRLKREAQASQVQLDEGLLLELVRRALMGDKP